MRHVVYALDGRGLPMPYCSPARISHTAVIRQHGCAALMAIDGALHERGHAPRAVPPVTYRDAFIFARRRGALIFGRRRGRAPPMPCAAAPPMTPEDVAPRRRRAFSCRRRRLILNRHRDDVSARDDEIDGRTWASYADMRRPRQARINIFPAA